MRVLSERALQLSWTRKLPLKLPGFRRSWKPGWPLAREAGGDVLGAVNLQVKAKKDVLGAENMQGKPGEMC